MWMDLLLPSNNTQKLFHKEQTPIIIGTNPLGMHFVCKRGWLVLDKVHMNVKKQGFSAE